MADIDLVIKISEKAYNALTHTEFDAKLVVDEMHALRLLERWAHEQMDKGKRHF